MPSKALVFIMLSSCAARGPWTLDKIASGSEIFDLARLSYQNKEERSPLRLEILKMGDTIDLIISFTEYTICPSKAQDLNIRFIIGDNPPFEELATVNKGNMRVLLSSDTRDKIIKGLQEGFKIDIVVDGVEEIIFPHQFARNYEKFIKKGFFE